MALATLAAAAAVGVSAGGSEGMAAAPGLVDGQQDVDIAAAIDHAFDPAEWVLEFLLLNRQVRDGVIESVLEHEAFRKVVVQGSRIDRVLHFRSLESLLAVDLLDDRLYGVVAAILGLDDSHTFELPDETLARTGHDAHAVRRLLLAIDTEAVLRHARSCHDAAFSAAVDKHFPSDQSFLDDERSSRALLLRESIGIPALQGALLKSYPRSRLASQLGDFLARERELLGVPLLARFAGAQGEKVTDAWLSACAGLCKARLKGIQDHPSEQLALVAEGVSDTPPAKRRRVAQDSVPSPLKEASVQTSPASAPAVPHTNLTPAGPTSPTSEPGARRSLQYEVQVQHVAPQADKRRMFLHVCSDRGGEDAQAAMRALRASSKALKNLGTDPLPSAVQVAEGLRGNFKPQSEALPIKTKSQELQETAAHTRSRLIAAKRARVDAEAEENKRRLQARAEEQENAKRLEANQARVAAEAEENMRRLQARAEAQEKAKLARRAQEEAEAREEAERAERKAEQERAEQEAEAAATEAHHEYMVDETYMETGDGELGGTLAPHTQYETPALEPHIAEQQHTTAVHTVAAPNTAQAQAPRQPVVHFQQPTTTGRTQQLAPNLMARQPSAHTVEWSTPEDDIEVTPPDEAGPSGSRMIGDTPAPTLRLPPPPDKVCICTFEPLVDARPHIENRALQAGRRIRQRFSRIEEAILREAVIRFGKGKWRQIMLEYSHVFVGRTQVDLKDKWRNIEKNSLM
eukprot:jgi/Chlat1/3409/Chrsp23S03742